MLYAWCLISISLGHESFTTPAAANVRSWPSAPACSSHRRRFCKIPPRLGFCSQCDDWGVDLDELSGVFFPFLLKAVEWWFGTVREGTMAR
jgi:hypothetical protein